MAEVDPTLDELKMTVDDWDDALRDNEVMIVKILEEELDIPYGRFHTETDFMWGYHTIQFHYREDFFIAKMALT